MATVHSLQMAKFEEFAKPLVEAGRFKNADDVLTAAMDALLREESAESKEAWLEQAIEDGEASGIAEGDVISRVLAGVSVPFR